MNISVLKIKIIFIFLYLRFQIYLSHYYIVKRTIIFFIRLKNVVLSRILYTMIKYICLLWFLSRVYSLFFSLQILLFFKSAFFKCKRNSTLEEHYRVRILRLAKIPTLYRDWLRSLNYEKGSLFEFHGREGGFKRHSMHCSKCRVTL